MTEKTDNTTDTVWTEVGYSNALHIIISVCCMFFLFYVCLPELEAEVEPELAGGPELAQLLPVNRQLAQGRLHRTH